MGDTEKHVSRRESLKISGAAGASLNPLRHEPFPRLSASVDSDQSLVKGC